MVVDGASVSVRKIVIMVFNLIGGFVLVIAHFIMQNLPTTQEADKVLVHLWRFQPPYVFGEALLGISATWYQNELGASNDILERVSIWEYEVAGRALIVLPAEAAAYTCLLLLIEHWNAVLSLLAPCLRVLCGTAEPSLRTTRATKGVVGGAVLLAIILSATGKTQMLVFGWAVVLFAGVAVFFWERRYAHPRLRPPD